VAPRGHREVEPLHQNGENGELKKRASQPIEFELFMTPLPE
jgi:hypothetical protein